MSGTILIAGAPGAGQNALIETISEIGLVSTRGHDADAPPVDMGQVTLGSAHTLTLLGVEGTGGYNFINGVVSGNILGTILLVDRSRATQFDIARDILSAIRDSGQPYIIAVHQRRPALTVRQANLALVLGSGPHISLHDIDVNEPETIRNLLINLTNHEIT